MITEPLQRKSISELFPLVNGAENLEHFWFSKTVFESELLSGSQIFQTLTSLTIRENVVDSRECGDFCGDAVSQWCAFFRDGYARKQSLRELIQRDLAADLSGRSPGFDAFTVCDSDCVRLRQMKGHGSKFGWKKEEAIIALLTQRNLEEAAKSIGVAPNTLLKWQKLPEFDAAYAKRAGDRTGRPWPGFNKELPRPPQPC